MGKSNRSQTEKKPISHVLVIRLSAMGDVAMTVPVILALVKQYPELRITVLTRGIFKAIFLELPNVEVYIADVMGKHKGVRGLWKLFKELKKLHIDAIADLHNVLRSNILKWYFGLIKIPFKQIDKGRAEKKELTSLKNKIIKPLKTTHNRYVDVFERLGFPINLSPDSFLPRQRLSNKAIEIIGTDTRKWIGIAPFAAYKGKMYPLDLMEQVIRQLNNTEKYKMFFFGGGENERLQLEEWEKQFHNGINIAGRLSLDEELALISNLDLMLAMDSANAHLAAMYGISTITLWGVTHPYAGFYPFGQDASNALLADREKYPFIPSSIYGNKNSVGYEKAIETIAPDMVLHKIDEVLKTN